MSKEYLTQDDYYREVYFPYSGREYGGPAKPTEDIIRKSSAEKPESKEEFKVANLLARESKGRSKFTSRY